MPTWVVDYVLVHELAHLLEQHHDAGVLGLGRPLPPRRAGQGLPARLVGRRRARRPSGQRRDRRGPRGGRRHRRRGERWTAPPAPSARAAGPARGRSARASRPRARAAPSTGHHRTSSDSSLTCGRRRRRGRPRRSRTSRWCTVPRGSQKSTACSSRCSGTGSRRRSAMPDSSTASRRADVGQRGVAGLAVAAEGEPAPGLAVQVEQHVLAGRVEDQRAGGQVVGEAGPRASRRGAARGGRRSASRSASWAGVGRRPGPQHGERVGVAGSLLGPGCPCRRRSRRPALSPGAVEQLAQLGVEVVLGQVGGGRRRPRGR